MAGQRSIRQCWDPRQLAPLLCSRGSPPQANDPTTFLLELPSAEDHCACRTTCSHHQTHPSCLPSEALLLSPTSQPLSEFGTTGGRSLHAGSPLTLEGGMICQPKASGHSCSCWQFNLRKWLSLLFGEKQKVRSYRAAGLYPWVL